MPRSRRHPWSRHRFGRSFPWQIFPVVDEQKWTGWSLFVGFNNVFFMSLMFFLSGLFVYDSVARKGVGLFLGDRLLRLGLPFALAAAIASLARTTGRRRSRDYGSRLAQFLLPHPGCDRCVDVPLL